MDMHTRLGTTSVRAGGSKPKMTPQTFDPAKVHHVNQEPIGDDFQTIMRKMIQKGQQGPSDENDIANAFLMGGD